MELAHKLLSIPEVLDWFPCIFVVSISFPMDKILDLAVNLLNVQDSIHFILFVCCYFNAVVDHSVWVCWFK